MRKKLDYNVILEVLNEELRKKYSNPELYNKIEEFYEEEYRHYFTLEKNDLGFPDIFFLNYLVFSDSIHRSDENSEEEVISRCKEWFNNYIDTLNMLKL